MKMNCLIKGFLLLSTILMFSCSQDDFIETSVDTEKSHRVSIEEAKSNVLNFISKLDVQTRANFKNVRIDNVECVLSSDVLGTRASDTMLADTMFYILNFADSCGFAITSTDDRSHQIYALVEDGNYSFNINDTTDTGFDDFIVGMIMEETNNRQHCLINYNTEEDNIVDGPIIIPNKPDDKFEVMQPLLKTRWGQGYPYNIYCNGYPTGCVPTAISQICSFLEAPAYISYPTDTENGSGYINWSDVKDECENNCGYPSSSDIKQQIGFAMRAWGCILGARYTMDGTSVKANESLDKLKTFFNVTGYNDYDRFSVYDIMCDLRSGEKIVLMIGEESNSRAGHAWVIDGYIDEIKFGIATHYLHCNWGWSGEKNGYFISNAFRTLSNPIYDIDTYSSIFFNYNTKLRTATFTK